MENAQNFTLVSVIQGESLTHPGTPTPTHVPTLSKDGGCDSICLYQQASAFATDQVESKALSPSLPSPMVRKVISKAAKMNIRLAPGSQIPGDGNCVFVALLANINSRPVFRGQ